MFRSLKVIVGLALGLWVAPAYSQTTGAIVGIVTDNTSHQAVSGAVVEATSPSLMGKQTTITKSDGSYRFPLLPAGKYTVTVKHEGNRDYSQTNLTLNIEQTIRVDVGLEAQEVNAGEQLVTAKRALVDTQSNTQQTILTPELLTKRPVGSGGSQLLAALTIAPGSMVDGTGNVTLNGTTGYETGYLIDGLSSGDISVGGPSTNLPTAFIKQIEIKSAGFQAEYGRSEGGIVNVVSKTGGNEFHGDVYANDEPSWLRANQIIIPSQDTAIESKTSVDYLSEQGFTLGGYFLKDKIWFFVGLQDTLQRDTVDRIVMTRMPDATGVQPLKDDKGNFVYIPTGYQEEWNWWYQRLQPQVSLTFLLGENNNLDLRHLGSIIRQSGAIGGLANAPESFLGKFLRDNSDYSLHWTSRLFGGSMLVEALAGWHRDQTGTWPLAGGNGVAKVTGYQIEDPEFTQYQVDPLSLIDVPVTGYTSGGWGQYQEVKSYEAQAWLHATNFVDLLGHHEIMYGVEFDRPDYWFTQGYSSGYFLEFTSPIADPGTRHYEFSANPAAPGQDWTKLIPASISKTRDFYTAYFLRDSWNARPNFTFNAGLRFERQEVRDYKNSLVFSTGSPTSFQDGWSPRLGLNYDWTNTGKTSLRASYGRFYEELPQFLNTGDFGSSFLSYARQCTDGSFHPGGVCPAFGGNAAYTAPTWTTSGVSDAQVIMTGYDPETGVWSGRRDVKGQYHEEFTLGYDQAITPDLHTTLSFQRRYQGRIIEDFSWNNGGTFLVGNPGFGWAKQAYDLPVLQGGQGTGQPLFTYPRPERNYNEVQLQVEKRLADNWQFLGSYTWSHTYGNYNGLFQPNFGGGGQAAGNVSTFDDFQALMVNYNGDLDQDIRHKIKLDGTYDQDLGRWGSLTSGGTFKYYSGTPLNAQGREGLYYQTDDLIFLVPRGTAGRNPAYWLFDVSLGYKYNLSSGRSLELKLDIFNIFNRQIAAGYDDRYTVSSVTNLVTQGTSNYYGDPSKWTLARLEQHTVPDWVYEQAVNPNLPAPLSQWRCTPGNPCKNYATGQQFSFQRYDPATDTGYLVDDVGSFVYKNLNYGKVNSYTLGRIVRIGLDYTF